MYVEDHFFTLTFISRFALLRTGVNTAKSQEGTRLLENTFRVYTLGVQMGPVATSMFS